MSTTSRTFVFATDAEGLADHGDTANITFAYESGDGSPSSGCVKFTSAYNGLSDTTERARAASTGENWETWGVPSGNIVTAVEVVAWKYKVTDATGYTDDLRIRARIVDSGGTVVHSAGDILDYAVLTYPSSPLFGWQGVLTGTNRSVDAAYQISTTDVRLELEFEASSSGTTNIAAYFDSIEVELTYETAPPASYEYVYVNPETLDGESEEFPAPTMSGAYSLAVSTLEEGAETFPTPSMSDDGGTADSYISPLALTEEEETFPAPTPAPSATLKFRQCRDLQGAVWTSEVDVEDALGPAAGVWLNPEYGALYHRDGNTYWITTPKPDDWTITAEVDTGMDGFINGLAQNNDGVLMALSGYATRITYDAGQTWVATDAQPSVSAGLATIVAVDEAFVVINVGMAGLSHVLTQDVGAHWEAP